MNQDEALAVLRQQLDAYRIRPYSALRQLIGAPLSLDARGASGTAYQMQIQAVWEDHPDGVLRILGGIDDRGWRRFTPLVDSFLVDP